MMFQKKWRIVKQRGSYYPEERWLFIWFRIAKLTPLMDYEIIKFRELEQARAFIKQEKESYYSKREVIEEIT